MTTLYIKKIGLVFLLTFLIFSVKANSIGGDKPIKDKGHNPCEVKKDTSKARVRIKPKSLGITNLRPKNSKKTSHKKRKNYLMPLTLPNKSLIY